MLAKWPPLKLANSLRGDAVFGVFMFSWVFLDESHLVANHACILVAFTAQIWAEYVDRYIVDRKYSPLPDHPYDPSETWAADKKPFRSEHWGEL
jgi:hypothetical protein